MKRQLLEGAAELAALDDGVPQSAGVSVREQVGLADNSVREQVGLADVAAVLATDTPPPVLMMPKVRTPDEVVWLDGLLTERGHATRLQVIIETNQGLEAAYDIAHCSTRINALFFGGVDMAAELRCRNTWESLLYARSRVVHAAASGRVDVIDVPYLDLEDADGMAEAARQAAISIFRARVRSIRNRSRP